MKVFDGVLYRSFVPTASSLRSFWRTRRLRSTASASLRTLKASPCSRRRESNPPSSRRWWTCCRWGASFLSFPSDLLGVFGIVSPTSSPLCVLVGLVSSPLQSCALHPPALVLHHHLQCGQTPDEGQAAGKSESYLNESFRFFTGLMETQNIRETPESYFYVNKNHNFRFYFITNCHIMKFRILEQKLRLHENQNLAT